MKAAASAFSSTTHEQDHAGCQCRSHHVPHQSTELWCPQGPQKQYSGTSMLSLACLNFCYHNLSLPSIFPSVCCLCLKSQLHCRNEILVSQSISLWGIFMHHKCNSMPNIHCLKEGLSECRLQFIRIVLKWKGQWIPPKWSIYQNEQNAGYNEQTDNHHQNAWEYEIVGHQL